MVLVLASLHSFSSGPPSCPLSPRHSAPPGLCLPLQPVLQASNAGPNTLSHPGAMPYWGPWHGEPTNPQMPQSTYVYIWCKAMGPTRLQTLRPRWVGGDKFMLSKHLGKAWIFRAPTTCTVPKSPRGLATRYQGRPLSCPEVLHHLLLPVSCQRQAETMSRETTDSPPGKMKAPHKQA